MAEAIDTELSLKGSIAGSTTKSLQNQGREEDEEEEDRLSLPESDTKSLTVPPVEYKSPKSSKRRQYWEELNETIQATSINGLSQAFSKSDRKYKTFWVIVFVLGVLAFCINLYTITAHFLEDPILTQIEREKQTFTWPDFTLCNPVNPIPFWTNETLMKKFKEWITHAEANYPELRYDDEEGNKKIWEQYMATSTIIPREFYKHMVRSTIQSMSVLYEPSSIAAYSSNSDAFKGVKNFESVFDIKMYTIRSPIACITLVPDRLRKVVSELRKAKRKIIGIKLYVLMDARSYMDFDIGFESRKIYFYITEPRGSFLQKFPYYILPGTDSNFRIKETIHKRIADCTKKQFTFQLYDIDMNSTWDLNGGFEDCRAFVSQEKFVEKCSCYNPYLPIFKFPNTKPAICTNMSLYDETEMVMKIMCVNFVLKMHRHSLGFEEEITKRCGEYRRTPCKAYVYSTLRYTSTWQDVKGPTRQKSEARNVKILKNFKETNKNDKNFLKENLAIVKLDWSGEETEATFESYEYPFGQYMSDFGGIIGLWVGLSVISVFEFIEIIIKLVKYSRAD